MKSLPFFWNILHLNDYAQLNSKFYKQFFYKIIFQSVQYLL